MFNKVAFDSRFNTRLNDLRSAEKITRAALMDLSREVFVAFHATEDIDYINRILEVLTPVNKKVSIEFFKEFSGFKYDEKQGKFSGKDKKHYDEKKAATIAWLEDPLNNIWTWAERNITIEKEFDFSSLKKGAEQLLKKADKNGFKKADVFKALMESGVTEDDLIGFIESLGFVEVKA